MYRHTIDYCLNEHAGENGIAKSDADIIAAGLQSALDELRARRQLNSTPLLNLPFENSDYAELEALAVRIRKQFRHIVVAGAGGSGLSGKTLTWLQPSTAFPAFHFLENIDPDTMSDVFNHLDVATTCFLVISKSGTTVETLSQLYVLLDHVKDEMGTSGIAERFIIITMPGDNPMRRAAELYGIQVLDHAEDIGGRFSILTNVGLLPAAIAGLDIRALRRGAQQVVNQLDKAAHPGECHPAMGAALQYAFIQKGHNISVMLPYSERLSGFSSWYRQLWAESLGKHGRGSTPIRAVGTTDQHSQLQLYLDGPKDKLFHVILLTRAGTGQQINVPDSPELDYMRGKTTGDIMAAEQKATLETLIRKKCPVRVFHLPDLKEEQMGALLMHFMLEVIFMSYLLQVNPFDQPAVEDGKQLARDYLLTGNL